MSTSTSSPTGTARTAWTLPARLVWTGTVAGALWLMLRGLWAGVYFEPTSDALARAEEGLLLVGGSCCLLVLAAVYAALVARWPAWVTIGVLAPVVLCGGLTWTAPETLFPVVAVPLAYPAALAAAVGGLLARRRSGPPAS